MSMTRDEELLARRFIDLSRQAQQRDTVLFSEYLNLNELNIFHQGISELYSSFEMSGGYAWSERQMIAFIPDAFCYAWNYPIACLEITPVNQKFAEELSHRDVRGTLMGLGIERGCRLPVQDIKGAGQPDDPQRESIPKPPGSGAGIP